MATDSDSLSSLSLATRGLSTSNSPLKLGELENSLSYKLESKFFSAILKKSLSLFDFFIFKFYTYSLRKKENLP